MADAERREKVLMGLTCCANLDGWSERVCRKCPYNCDGDGIGGCEDHLIADTFVLLKEQEARVMSWGKVLEFIELPNEGFSEKTPCYVEVYEPDPSKIKWVDAETLHGWMRNCKMREQRRLSYNSIGRHGWRLWTSRPTPEQMRDTKWEVKNE